MLIKKNKNIKTRDRKQDKYLIFLFSFYKKKIKKLQ